MTKSDAESTTKSDERTKQARTIAWHGQHAKPDWAAPSCVTEFSVAARDYCDEKIMAHEYLEDERTLESKIGVLADLIRRSQNLVAFTGAGISTAAGIDDYASKAKEASATAAGRPVVKDWKLARPTKAHRVLAVMHDAGHLKHWITQNHDSLPQKAGFPQHKLNEIHGSLHDPANPIVPYEGSLRDDLFEWLEEWKARSDLTLALGTSLSGFNVDSVAEAAAAKAGLVIVNLQRTPYDDGCALRIFAKVDDVLEKLAHALGIAEGIRPMDATYAPCLAEGALFTADAPSVRIPFDGVTGGPLPAEAKTSSWATWDLRIGQRVRLTGGPYEGDVGTITEWGAADGSIRIRFEDSVHPVFKVKRRPFSLWLGTWWLEAASHGRGVVPGGRVPIVNV